jgi:hypothetical protein
MRQTPKEEIIIIIIIYFNCKGVLPGGSGLQ